MNASTRASAIIAGLCVLLAGPAATSQPVLHRYTGTVPGGTPDFHVKGPWLLNWSAVSEFPLMANLELDLYDANTGRFVGTVVQEPGNSSGEKIIKEGGRYRLAASGQNTKWSVQIQEAPASIVEALKKHPDATRVRLVAPDFGLPAAIVHGVKSWQAGKEDKTLHLTLADGSTLRTTFYGGAACHGLHKSADIFFVTAGIQGDKFNAIMLENGTRCYLGSYAPQG